MTPNKQQPTLPIPTRPSTPSESDSDKENVQPDVLHDTEDPDVPRTASASPHEEGEILQGNGEARERTPNLQEEINQDHPRSQNDTEETGIRQYRCPPTPFRTIDEHDHTIHGDFPSNRPFSTLYERPSHQRPISTFERIRTSGEINQRLTLITDTMGYCLATDYQDQLKVLWGLLRDE